MAIITGQKDTKMLMRYTHLRAEDLDIIGRDWMTVWWAPEGTRTDLQPIELLI
ncbi:MAG: hypothetical protein MK411_10610 [SAR202 cluster bacterium]|nr:hypothetical protein [SAR202 cluster bacterium]